MEALLRFQDVSFSYHTLDGETDVLSHISFEVKEGDFLAIVGPSGCGKSTILSLIAGLLKPEEGSIFFHEQLAAAHGTTAIGYMLQKDHLFEWRNIRKNAMLGLEIQRKKTKEHMDYVDTLLEKYGLEEFKTMRPSQLSGGMRQRAALIRTLALQPRLLLLDEPFSALDYQTRLEVGNDIGMIIREEEKTAILVTHDLSEAISLGNRIIVLSDRPCTVKEELQVVFPDGLSPLEKRNEPVFQEYFQSIWKEMRHHDGAA
ncbi:MAG: ABC transporter ATP-binding protein [Lachnospiraceae bacterium]